MFMQGLHLVKSCMKYVYTSQLHTSLAFGSTVW